MVIKYAVIAATACIVNLGLIIIFRRLALKNKFLLRNGVPAVGGIAIGIAFIIASLLGFLIAGGMPRPCLGILLASSVMLIVGSLDDRFDFSVRTKFLLQFFALGLLMVMGVKTQIVYIGELANIAITALWILGITNAYNHLDIIDGLAGGAAMIAAVAFLFLAIGGGNVSVIIMALALAGALAGFLIFNLPPAKIYMGNSGSHLVGFILAAVALLISYASMERKMALAAPLFILGLAIFDTVFLVVMRVTKGKSAFQKSNDHLALRFLKKGYSKVKALFVMLALGLYFALSGIYLTQVTNAVCATVIIVAGIVGVCLMADMRKVMIDG